MVGSKNQRRIDFPEWIILCHLFSSIRRKNPSGTSLFDDWWVDGLIYIICIGREDFNHLIMFVAILMLASFAWMYGVEFVSKCTNLNRTKTISSIWESLRIENKLLHGAEHSFHSDCIHLPRYLQYFTISSSSGPCPFWISFWRI